jgi:hypothetical protein
MQKRADARNAFPIKHPLPSVGLARSCAEGVVPKRGEPPFFELYGQTLCEEYLSSGSPIRPRLHDNVLVPQRGFDFRDQPIY